ncbi:MAG: VanZ family protein [Lachnospiraceae bacterium]|nr:VanZ family protein [Lachnospiraceae bacterium]
MTDKEMNEIEETGSEMERRMKKRRFCWFVLLLLIMLLIFSFSAQSGEASSEMSSRAEKLLALLKIDWLITPDTVRGIGVSVRKWAHIYVYMALGITACMWIGTWFFSVWKRMGLAALLCCIYSASDEFHQSFVPGRCGTVRDMLYDGVGWAAGIMLVIAAGMIRSYFWKIRRK